MVGDQNTKIRFDNSANGYRIATSVDGSLTGEGGDIICFPYDVLITTSAGDIPIGEIVDGKLPVKVVTLDDGGGCHERKILSYQINPGAELYEISFSSGAMLKCTGDHPIWVEGQGRYVLARDIQEGDRCLEVCND